MANALAEHIISLMSHASQLYYRLVLVVGPSGAGKTTAVKAVQKITGAPLKNVSLELSRRMLDLTERQRTLRLPALIDEIAPGEEPILLDNTEILFDVSLGHDPLRLLQELSRNKTVVAAWNGTVADGWLLYANPGHPEYRRYPRDDILITQLEAFA